MKEIRKHYELIVLSIILLAAFFLRFKFALLNFFQDEVYTAMAVKGILNTGIPQMPSGLLYLRAFPISYLSAAGSFLFGFSEWSVRLGPILLGVLSIGVFYVVLKKVTTPIFTAIGSLFLVLSPWHVWYSFFARSFLAQALLFFIILWFYYLFLKTKKHRYLIYNALLILISITLSPTVLLLVPTIGFVWWLSDKKLISQTTLLLGIHIVFSALAFVIPSVIEPWSSVVSENTYGLLEARSFILPNLYFWQELFVWFPVGTIVIISSFFYFYSRNKYLSIFSFFIISAFSLLSVFNPFQNLQPRYLSNILIVYFFAVFMYIYIILKEKITSKTTLYVAASILMLVCADLYMLPTLLQMDYGKNTPRMLQVSRSWDTFHDIKTNVEYVNQNADDDDIIISLQPKGQTEIYVAKKLDYFLRTANYEVEGHLDGSNFVDDYSLIPIITSEEQLQNLINSGRRIWIISSKSELPELGHINEETYQLLQNAKIVYTGREQYSKVYVIN